MPPTWLNTMSHLLQWVAIGEAGGDVIGWAVGQDIAGDIGGHRGQKDLSAIRYYGPAPFLTT